MPVHIEKCHDNKGRRTYMATGRDAEGDRVECYVAYTKKTVKQMVRGAAKLNLDWSQPWNIEQPRNEGGE